MMKDKYAELRKKIRKWMNEEITLKGLYWITGQLEDEIEGAWKKGEIDDIEQDDLKEYLNRYFTERSRSV